MHFTPFFGGSRCRLAYQTNPHSEKNVWINFRTWQFTLTVNVLTHLLLFGHYSLVIRFILCYYSSLSF